MHIILKKFGILAAPLVAALLTSQVLAGQSGGAAAPAVNAPRAVVPFNNYDFGDINRGEIISHVFVIRNEGKADLVISEFSSG
jgi:hypothetical protein